jgi:hypothetical protein
MLDYTKKLTHEEIWQDCFNDRLTDILMHLEFGHILPEGMKIQLKDIMPAPGQMSCMFNLVVSGREQPLTYTFMAQAANGVSFHITPLNANFVLDHADFEDGYSMTDVGSGFGGRFAADLLVSYVQELDDPGFNPVGLRAQEGRNWRPLMS